MKNSLRKSIAILLFTIPVVSYGANMGIDFNNPVPISTGFEFSYGSIQHSTHYISKAGDVNKDGYDDFIISMPLATPYQGLVNQRPNAGITYVVFGRKSGFPSSIDLATLSMPDGFQIFGACGTSCSPTGDKSGSSISSGDFNGDGYSDILIYAPQTPVNAGAGIYTSGTVYYVFGKQSGFTNVDLATVNTKIVNANTAIASATVHSAGDINGDGCDETIVASPLDGTSHSGMIYLLYGNKTMTGTTDMLGSKVVQLSGIYVSGQDGKSFSAGDVNGDHLSDMVISGANNAYILYGNKTRLVSTDLDSIVNAKGGFRIIGTNENSVYTVSNAGDVNGDGCDDVLIGGTTGYVVFGSKSMSDVSLNSLSNTAGFQITRVYNNPNYQPGFWPVSYGGDVNNDGYYDMLIGTSGSGTAVTTIGENDYVVFGHGGSYSNITLNNLGQPDGVVIQEPNISHSPSSGTQVGSLGDINGDGFEDFYLDFLDYSTTYFVFGNSSYPIIDITPPTSSSSGMNTGSSSGSHINEAASTSEIDVASILGLSSIMMFLAEHAL